MMSFSLALAVFSTATSAMLVGMVFVGLALFSISQLKETFGKDLDYNEGHQLAE